MKKRLLQLAALGAAVAFVGFLVAASGVIPVRASSGHWAITHWFLSFSMHRSIRTHAMGTEVPPLDDPNLALKGAGHYDLACAHCHGSPSRPPSGVTRAMTPPPPTLSRSLAEWGPAELFQIVKHGIKLTGMPAWPSQPRDDEVWAMVAFLRVLPRLDAPAYRRLVDGQAPARGDLPGGEILPRAEVPSAVLAGCARCHGTRGEGRGAGAYPALAGQRPGYLLASLEAYARQTRHSGIMGPVAADLRPEDRVALARYYAAMPAPSRAGASPSGDIARGREIAHRGVRGRRVPACVACHGPGGRPRNPTYPRLAGQYGGYLALQLQLFQSHRRGGTPYAHLMDRAAHGLTPDQIRDVARYYASLDPEAAPSP